MLDLIQVHMEHWI